MEEWMRVFSLLPVVSEMRHVKALSTKTQLELETLGKSGADSMAESLLLKERRVRQAAEKQIAQRAALKSEQPHRVEANFAILKQFAVAPDQLRRYYERFAAADKDGSGSVGYAEFCLVLESEENDLTKSLFNIFDQDGSGSVDLVEFIVGLAAYCTSASKEERLKFAFLICDSWGTGSLEKPDIAVIIRSNFLAQQTPLEEIQRRVDRIFKLSGSRNVITFQKFLDVAKRVPGLVYPAYVMLEDTSFAKRNTESSSRPSRMKH